MGQSLPLPTDLQPGLHADHERVGANHVTGGEHRDAANGAEAPGAPPSDVASATSTPDSFTAAIVRNKVRVPDMRPHTLERPRLLGWLEEYAQKRVRVIVAEAGYGKSTLIADHARRGRHRIAWYRLEAADVDWVGMLSYLVASIREVLPGFGVGAVNLLQRVGVLNPTRDMVLDIILADLDSTVTEPLTLVLDDFHVVQDGEDVRAIVARLIELAPSTMNFIIAARQHPSGLLARPMSHGDVVGIGTAELRFTRIETAHLLENILGGPLDDDLVQVLDNRLAGWVASLQLVATSLVGRRSGELRAAIEDLTSRSEPLYDFLAAQVLVRQPAPMRRVLSIASILERVEPTLVLAAMRGDSRVTRRRVEAVLAEAEASGFITRSPTSVRWGRFHPLVRDFMSSRLSEGTSRPVLLGMHLRVAQTAESMDWAVSAHHYIEAEHREDAMRVLRESAIEALGTASWGPATALADRMLDQPVPEAVTVLRALDMASRGQSRRAAILLEGLTPSPDDAIAWGVTKAALAHVYLVLGNVEGIRAVTAEIANMPGPPPVVASLAYGFDALLTLHEGGDLSQASLIFEDLAREHTRLGLTHYAGVSYHNAAFAAFARGQYDKAVRLANLAIEQFQQTPLRHGIESTQALAAQCHWELGHPGRASTELESLGAGERVPADAQADAAWMAAASGDTDSAWILVEQASRTAIDGSTVPSATSYVQYTRALAHLVDGNVAAARAAIVGALDVSVEPDAIVRDAAISALVALLSNDRIAAAQAARDGLAVSERQGAMHWTRWLRLLLAVAVGDADGFRRSLVNLTSTARLSTLVLADAIAQGLGLIGDAPVELVESMRAWPNRWLPALRRTVQGPDADAAMVAAGLLSSFGTIDDVPLLSAFERQHIRQPARRTLSRRLARHANPTLVVHDLGRLRIEVGSRLVPLSQSRRKPASLLAFLASRPSHSATRDQLLEAMWPNQAPEGAANSLHQTLFFLRRDIDPWFEDGHSVDYLAVEPDVVFLDPELVQVDSAAFFRQVSSALTSESIAELAVPLIRDYRAKFAMDFEYEDWSQGWRDQLHGLFLRAVEAAADELLAARKSQSATDLLQRALTVDPEAFELEAKLVIALHQAGAKAAVAHQYRRYARAYEAEFGEVAPKLSVLLADLGPSVA